MVWQRFEGRRIIFFCLVVLLILGMGDFEAHHPPVFIQCNGVGGISTFDDDRLQTG